MEKHSFWRVSWGDHYFPGHIAFPQLMVHPAKILSRLVPFSFCVSLCLFLSFFSFSLSQILGWQRSQNIPSLSVLVTYKDHGTRLRGLEAQASHVLDVWPWASYLMSLFLIFLICKVMIIIVFISHSVVKIMKYLKQCQTHRVTKMLAEWMNDPVKECASIKLINYCLLSLCSVELCTKCFHIQTPPSS